MNVIYRGLILLIYLIHDTGVFSVELTFELPDNAKECFYQQMDKGANATVEFQVNSDVANSIPSLHITVFQFFSIF